MKAFQKIKMRFPDATLTIIGRGELQHELTSLATQLNLGESFQLLQHLPKEQVREYMKKADVFCAASLEASNGDVEGIPNTLKEAMALGVPVLSTTHAGIPELITHQKEGILVQENHVDELVEGLEFMLTRQDLWETFTLAARKKVEHSFDLNQQLLVQANYYNELLGGRNHGRF
jgi:colanic acid/amylovoran biosynthesis glycosyltransferase